MECKARWLCATPRTAISPYTPFKIKYKGLARFGACQPSLRERRDVDALLTLAEMCVQDAIQERWMILDVPNEVGGLLRRLRRHALSPVAVLVTCTCHVGLHATSDPIGLILCQLAVLDELGNHIFPCIQTVFLHGHNRDANTLSNDLLGLLDFRVPRSFGRRVPICWSAHLRC